VVTEPNCRYVFNINAELYSQENVLHSTQPLYRSVVAICCLQCFGSVWRASGIQACCLIWATRRWLSVWSGMQMICICSSWCHCHPIISCFINIQLGLTFLVPAYQGCPGKEAIKRVSVFWWHVIRLQAVTQQVHIITWAQPVPVYDLYLSTEFVPH